MGLKHEKYMTEYNACKKIQDNQTALSSCEEITETFVICNGNKYIVDSSFDNRLKRDAKKIEEHINSGKTERANTSVSK